MSTFADAAFATIPEATTWNGAPSLATTGSARVDLFYGACRGKPEDEMCKLLETSWNEEKLHTLKIVAYCRDCRGGKGERAISRYMLNWLAKNATEEIKHNMTFFLDEFGRFDDALAFMDTPLENDIYGLLADQLKKDLKRLSEGEKSISLAAKWIPSERKSADKDSKVYKKLCKHMKISFGDMRKTYISPLRAHLDVLERKMCAKQWEEIEFSAVPSLAMKIHGKPKGAFQRHAQEKFSTWKAGLVKGETKVNASVLYPYQVVESYINKYGYYYTGVGELDELVEAQWIEMVKKGKAIGELASTLVMSDVSGSMYGTPILNSVSLGILVSEIVEEPFKGLVLTFESQPQFHKVTGNSLLEKVKCLIKAPWGGSTDFAAALDLILRTAKSANLEPEKMPKRLVVISDMQFNEAGGGSMTTNYEALKIKYKNAGYEVPQLVFWNVNGQTSDVPTRSNVENVSLISGFSVEVLKAVLENKEVTPFSTMMTAISAPRYDKITLPKMENEEESDGTEGVIAID
ncbi:hypothetical protein HK098_003755 [Nowakowskiella sp. JEL0407]|nr:hypothetical protein HK098_003755 [Nowakowskiella sp. JEL0407]